jgi:hypothetical protein
LQHAHRHQTESARQQKAAKICLYLFLLWLLLPAALLPRALLHVRTLLLMLQLLRCQPVMRPLLLLLPVRLVC